MKMIFGKLGIVALVGTFFGGAAALADFNAIVCQNPDLGINTLALTRNTDGSGLYDLNINHVLGNPGNDYANSLSCQSIAASSGGLPLVSCTRYVQGKTVEVKLTHVNDIEWANVDSQGNVAPTHTGDRVEFILNDPFNTFDPYTRILRFQPSQCSVL